LRREECASWRRLWRKGWRGLKEQKKMKCEGRERWEAHDGAGRDDWRRRPGKEQRRQKKRQVPQNSL
jgi:hypothetical protein